MIANVVKQIFRTTFRLSLIAGCAAATAGYVTYREYAKRAEVFDLSAIGQIPERSVVYDASGHVFSYIQGENRLLVPLGKVPPYFVQGLLAREDSRFWQHHGIDYIGIARAFVENLRGGGVRQGGSTVTQQLARNTFMLKGRTLDRKILEAVLAQRIEKNFTKEAILEAYLNRVYFGAGAYGIQRAAQVYFGKPAEALTLPESAVLIGLIPSPNRYSPIANRDGAVQQQRMVLARMEQVGLLTPEQVEAARRAPLEIFGKRLLPQRHSYAMDAVRRELDFILSPEQVGLGGLKIYTTLDPVLQGTAEKAVSAGMDELEAQKSWPYPKKADFVPATNESDEEKPTPYVQAALVAIENESGAIRAIVGGRDYSHSKYDRAMMSRRSVGSTFKPFVYAAAFERGLLPGSWVSDDRIEPGEYPDLPKSWSPRNSDDNYTGLQPAAIGLIRSRNTMSVRVGEFASLAGVMDLARGVGLGRSIRAFPSSFLGGFEATLRDLTAAYTVFPNLGERIPSYLIERIEGPDGNVFYQSARSRKRAMPEDVAGVISELLGEVLRVGTGARSSGMGLTRPAAGKTGTSNEAKDAWFVGYTSSLTCGVWVGFDKPRPMRGGYGGTLAMPLWVRFVQNIPAKKYPALSLARDGSRTPVALCSQSNARATTACEHAQTAYTMYLPSRMIPYDHCHIQHYDPYADPYAASRGPDRRDRRSIFHRFFGGNNRYEEEQRYAPSAPVAPPLYRQNPGVWAADPAAQAPQPPQHGASNGGGGYSGYDAYSDESGYPRALPGNQYYQRGREERRPYYRDPYDDGGAPRQRQEHYDPDGTPVRRAQSLD